MLSKEDHLKIFARCLCRRAMIWYLEVPVSGPEFDNDKPRKPRYLNKIQTGYLLEPILTALTTTRTRPPPKMVLGYRFNIFYPDLIDKSDYAEIHGESMQGLQGLVVNKVQCRASVWRHRFSDREWQRMGQKREVRIQELVQKRGPATVVSVQENVLQAIK